MNNDRFPRATVYADDKGEISLSFMQNGWKRVFYLQGSEAAELSNALALAASSPGKEIRVEWDDKARGYETDRLERSVAEKPAE